MKKIVAISMVKNEMDIIESFVRHTLGFADLLIVADHKSTDRTREILEALRAEGLPLLIVSLNVMRYAQAEIMTKLLHQAAFHHEADIILPLDADEFLVPTGEASVRGILDHVDIEHSRALVMRRYLPKSDAGIPVGEFALSTPLLRVAGPPRGQKVMVSGDCVRKYHVGLAQGNHSIVLKSDGVIMQKQGLPCDGLELAHFDWRSPAQICSKYAVAWPNIVAQFSCNTLFGGSYRRKFHDIRNGILPGKEEPQMHLEPFDWHGYVRMPELRYSAGTAPDVLSNLMAASEMLAEELAEMRAFRREPHVTTVIPYPRGGQSSYQKERFDTTLSSALMEDYPWREIVVPIFATISEKCSSELAAKGVRVVCFKELLASIQGDYVECLLPGETVQPQKLRRMVACAELQKESLLLSLLFFDGGDSNDMASPYFDFRVSREENMRIYRAGTVWKFLLKYGKYPSRGLAGVLMRRNLFLACGGFLDLLADGGRRKLSIWRSLLSSGKAPGDDWPAMILGILREDGTESVQELSLENIAAHQLDWHALCIEDSSLLSDEEQQNILDSQRRIGIYLLEHAIASGIDLQSGIWPAYQQMLASL